jgi:uncharacterized protein YecE (DUF72 family)
VGLIRVGTSGWNYPAGRGTWNGIFYPARRGRGFDELAYYAEHFDSVEVNSTFYRMPEPAMAAAWVRRTPPSFEFSVKLYQKFTHPDMYLARGGASDWDVTVDDLDLFRRGIDPLAAAARLGVVLIQFPASVHAGPETRDYIGWLARALGDYTLGVELRHQSWSDEAPATAALLDEARAAWVYIDEPKFHGSIRQDLEGIASTGAAPHVYVRMHGRKAETWWTHDQSADRYDYLYSADELRPLAAATAKASAGGRRVRVHFNNHFSAKSVADAALLKHQLGDLVAGDYPREMVDRYPELAGVVRTAGLPI